MRQSTAARRLREQFYSNALRKALPVTWAEVSSTEVEPDASPHGADVTAATLVLPDLGVWVASNLTMSDGFSELWEDRAAHGAGTALDVDATWRERMLTARKVCSTAGLSREDCDKVLQLGIYGEVRHPAA